jgi:hypothetical protein
VRIDVENPNPSARPGQIHIQEGSSKFYYHHVRRLFYNPKTGAPAPQRYQEILRNPKVVRAIEQGEKILGLK